MDAAFTFYMRMASASLNSSSLMRRAEQWPQWRSHGCCVHILQDEGHRLAEQQLVDGSKQSSTCNGGLMDASTVSNCEP